MIRWTTTLFGALFLASLVLVILGTRQPVPRVEVVADGGPDAEPDSAESPDAGLATPPPVEPGSAVAPATSLPDGGAVPELPRSAPRSVEFGVVLVTYRGAQLAAKDARSKAEARRKAAMLLELARSDFEEAVKKGDRGSTADAGTLPRGVLEPAIEYALFTLEPGQVYDSVLDTPRGFWIIRRNE